ncbi:DNA alkylation repair protein [Mucilaginibacter pallidiroseus]|uniref:DNA alkylation repair protein n=1 Tax=Mucilaginibacter pallidiroseus TaxID=2599295 RepID=A0A563UEK5_9SPHI|nr:DNA alkylation repair protein [Mucilaginibacter pallidiroseus]TWR29791.1 DNA alkylation repair protein [Mucilaginibacter pallidiroseus]
MTVDEILGKLKALRNEKMFAHNIKYGATEQNQFGVKMGDIRALAKPIKTNQQLAIDLWATGNIEARFLATLIIKPEMLSPAELDEMVRSINFAPLADWFNSYVVKEYPGKEDLREGWMRAENAYAARAGWSLTAGRVTRNPEGIDLAALLDRIEREMPNAGPETQWTMNTTLAQIGINHPAYRERALVIGEKLGIYRDFPVSKGCTSPFAPIWINEMVSRQK